MAESVLVLVTTVYVWLNRNNAVVSPVWFQLVAQSLRFISTAIRTGYYKELFATKETISSLIQGVVVPNVGLRGDH